jgi:hypothetical protein
LEFDRVLSLGVGQDALGVLLSGFGHLEFPFAFLRGLSFLLGRNIFGTGKLAPGYEKRVVVILSGWAWA